MALVNEHNAINTPIITLNTKPKACNFDLSNKEHKVVQHKKHEPIIKKTPVINLKQPATI